MTDDTNLVSASSASVQTDEEDDHGDSLIPTPFDHAQERADRKAHRAELETRVTRDDYSPKKIAQYRAALARARAEVKSLEKDA